MGRWKSGRGRNLENIEEIELENIEEIECRWGWEPIPVLRVDQYDQNGAGKRHCLFLESKAL